MADTSAGGCVNRATTGCTTMAEQELVKMIAWMRASGHPCYALLPADEYEKKWRGWDLPPAEKTVLHDKNTATR